jgi:hypothetical protein
MGGQTPPPSFPPPPPLPVLHAYGV